MQVGDGVLCQDGDIVGVDELRYAVVDLRVNVVGAPCQDDAPVSCLIQERHGLLALFAHVIPAFLQLDPGFVDRVPDLGCRNGEFLSQLFNEP